MNTTETKPRRGRPKGSNSFTNVKLSDLIEKYGPDTILPVGRLWLMSHEKPALVESGVVPVISTNDQPRVLGLIADEPKIEFSLVD